MFVPNQPTEQESREFLSVPRSQAVRPYFLYVGRLEKLKGLQKVIPFFAQQDQVNLLVVGTGQYEHELKHLARKSPYVVFLGSLPFDRLRQLYAHAVAVIVPSLCYETFGLVVAEAFSFKTPVIAQDIGALSELVTMSGGGLLYRNSQEFAYAIELLRRNPELKIDLGERGHETYQKQWTEEQHLDRYLALIKQIGERKQIGYATV
jgi:glycosyltransferase involved in cell wall biosynthesis